MKSCTRVDIEHFPAEFSSGVVERKYRLVLIAIARRAEIIISSVGSDDDEDPIDIRFEKGAAKAILCWKGWGCVCRGGVEHSMMCVCYGISQLLITN
ncbi:hypothetical protein CEXT_743181 [Caerostris extrusa]|uniref:DNA-directed RNA polymerase n=1 Tax=Caerostris extrusa TaxID=172846 RepID=A0AAV4SYI0_CAEEX|nr:hypothetical protein CEXT_743181 [Caerostris extrusa]